MTLPRNKPIASKRAPDPTQRVTIADVCQNIAQLLNGKVVGYACSIGSASISTISYGYARTVADAPAQLFLPSTKIPVASVSKVLTALAAIRILAKNNVSLDSKIDTHLPSGWKLDPYVASITFSQLLSQTSGIKDYGSSLLSYDDLKTFFTQIVDPSKNTPCQPWYVDHPKDPINTIDKSRCYSNYNFGIFRVLLPMIDGFVDDPANRAAKLTEAYIKIVQREVFDPVGVQGVDAKPPSSGQQAGAYALSYQYPGTAKGHDWGDTSDGVGAAGWYLAIDDIDKVLSSLNQNDGRILTSAQLQDMVARQLAWDWIVDSNGYRWVEKNGEWDIDGTMITTSVGLFGPGVFGALFINSDRSEPNLEGGWQSCNKCQALAYADDASAGRCPAGGEHDHSGSENYFIATAASGVAGEHNWRWCNKCQALSYAGGSSPGPCSACGQHDHTGSEDYVLVKNSGAIPDANEDNWKCCNKCQVLSYADKTSPGACAGGGTHDYAGSADYLLEFQIGADDVLYSAYMNALKPA